MPYLYHIFYLSTSVKAQRMTSLPSYPNAKSYSLSPQGLTNIIKNEPERKLPGQHVLWTDDVRVELPVRLGSQGIASLPPSTIRDEWTICLTKYAKEPALSVKRNKQWITLNFQEYYDESIRFAKSLIKLGLNEFSGVNMIGFNAPQWAIAFHGSTFARCIPVGIYTTNSKQICQYIAKHSEAKVIVAENRQLASKYFDLLETGEIWKIVLYNDEAGGNTFGGKVMSWQSFIGLGRDIEDAKVRERSKKITPGQCCTLVYTSGTTGMPKGVMLSHDNLTYTPKAQINRPGYPNPEKVRVVSYLPLSHVAGLYFDVVAPVIKSIHIHFAEATALQGTLVQTLQQVKPHFFFAVPRVWEKICGKLKQEENSKGSVAKNLIEWAQSHGTEGTIAEKRGESTSWQFKLAKKLVFDKVKNALGLDQAVYFGFGAAPLDPVVRKYLLSMNFLLLNVYGMTETTGPHSGTSALAFNPKTPEDFFEVGVPMPGCDTLIKKQKSTDEDGEICMRGRNIMMGYLKQADETNKTIDSEGFLASGDLGKISNEGYLFITGRAKELIITAGGENIPPVLIENEIKKALPCVANVMVVGEQKPYLNCLISLLEDPPMSGNLDRTAASFLAGKECPVKTIKEARDHPNFRKAIMEGLKEANSKAISRAQMVQNFYLMPEDFSVDNGTLTPSLKLKRKEALKKYSAQVEKMYETAKL